VQYAANARMYSVNPGAAAAWIDLFAWLARESGVDLHAIDHAFPLPLADLWSRPDLACAFMCGFPFTRARIPPKPVAAPVPLAAPMAGRPVYATRLVVRAESAFQSLEDTFGGRLGYTADDSHSGYNALRHHLLPYWLQHSDKLYRESVGPLYTPRRVIEAVLAKDIDVGPLDSYAFDLMLRHEPDLGKRIRIVATTESAPVPFLVASPDCPDHIVTSLQAALAQFGDAFACVGLRDRLCLQSFAPVPVSDYAMIANWDVEAIAAGYGYPG
jgi:ABC-type phosphate/phosphonate transport system substrate-binding protein